MFKMSSSSIYSQLNDRDSIRLLEVRRVSQGERPFCGRLITTRLCDGPEYVALSYVWGKLSTDNPVLLLDDQPLQIGQSLWQALKELTARVSSIRICIDQVCIDQGNKTEKEQQVRLMSRIYKDARRVIGWLRSHDDDSDLAFKLLLMLGVSLIAHGSEANLDQRRAANAFMATGHINTMHNLFDPSKRPVQAAALLVQRPWFRRLWIVQEVALASTLEFCCGDSSMPGDVFFGAIRMLCSVVSDPPMPWLLKPYRNAFKLGQLRAQVSAGQKHSFPDLAQTLSGWSCEKGHDRLNALYGLVFQDSQAWFTPSYSMSIPEFYTTFATNHIRTSRGLEILHFAGCGDSDTHDLFQAEDQVVLQANPPADDIASWVPDWRVQSRPLTLLTNFENISIGFSATQSVAEFELDSRILLVRAQEVDKIRVCGIPYYESLVRRLRISEHEIFNHWFNLAKTVLSDADVESMFASTMVMDGQVAVMEREGMGVNSIDVPSLFGQWAARNLDEIKSLHRADGKDGVDDFNPLRIYCRGDMPQSDLLHYRSWAIRSRLLSRFTWSFDLPHPRA